MSEPIVFISHFKIKEGKLDGLKEHGQKMIELIQVEKPGTVVFLQYFNEDATELSIIHVFPDGGACNKHGEGVAERARTAFEFIERKGIEIYGMPGTICSGTTRRTVSRQCVTPWASKPGWMICWRRNQRESSYG